MAEDTATDSGWLEEFFDSVSDKMNAATEWANRFLLRLLGSSNERYIRKLGYVRNKDGSHIAVPGSHLAQVNELEPKIRPMKLTTPSEKEPRASVSCSQKFASSFGSGLVSVDMMSVIS